jgi:osmoprotectant transport system permease protein
MPLPSADLLRAILLRSGEHLLLVGTAVGLALAISLPLGLWIQRRPAWAGPVMSLANGIQTIPSLAIFGLLLTVPLLGGIGPTPAIVALTLYALLPILRGILTGLDQVPRGLIEAGRALGLSDRQVLRHVELPLAAPALMAGLRVATVINVGVAAVAAAIGAGGLGVFIFRGIATVDNEQILAGALPAAAIALAADRGLGLLQRRLARGPDSPRRQPLGLLALALAALLGLLAWGLMRPPEPTTVRIGSKNFTEQLILGELLAQQIEADTSLTVQRDFGLGGTFLCHEAVRSGRIDGYVEYSGTAWTAILEQTPPGGDEAARRIREESRRLYRQRFGLTMLPPLGFENSFAILVRGADARRLGLETISQAAPHTPGWRAGFSYEFMTRADGYPGLSERYGLRFAGTPRAMDLGLTYRALAEGQVDLIAGDSTNGLIAALDLAQLEDDRSYFPPYEAVPVFHSDSLRRHPGLRRAVVSLAGRLSVATMRDLNAAVDVEGRPVEEVVRQWREQAFSGSIGATAAP